MTYRVLIVAAILAAAGTASAESPPAEPGTVSKEEYEKLKQEQDRTRAEVEELKARVKAIVDGTGKKPAAATDSSDVEEQLNDFEKELKKVRETAQSAIPGLSNFLITGYGSAGFEDARDEVSTFSVHFNPIFLWRVTDRIFFEGELEIGLEGNDSMFELEYAQAVYLLNDYMTIGAGKFLAPFGSFIERLHPAWINKLPDRPLALYDGITPESALGMQVRGGIPLGPTKANYAIYVCNGPQLNIGDGVAGDPGDVGKLDFHNFNDNNNDKAAGARVGFSPVPGLEIGGSIQAGQVGPIHTPFAHLKAVLYNIDFNLVHDVDFLKGTIDVRAEWAWSRVQHITYDADGSLGIGPVAFSNYRHGGYAQFAFRPSKLDVAVIKNLELVVRFDALFQPRRAPDAVDEKRWTFGVDYWLAPSAVVKLAFRLDDREDPSGPNQDSHALLAEFAIGF